MLNEIPSSTALHLLKECGATKQADEVVEVRRASKSPLNRMTEAVASLLQRKGLSATLLEQLLIGQFIYLFEVPFSYRLFSFSSTFLYIMCFVSHV